MENYIIGALLASAFWILRTHAKNNDLKIAWWQWLLAAACGLFVVFTLAVIIEFIHEGTLQGALVASLVLGIASVVWCILTWRLIFSGKAEKGEVA